MWHQRELKKPNWAKILGSNHALRKFLCPTHPTRSVAATSNCPKSSLLSRKPIKSATSSLQSRKPARPAKLKLNKCWQMATDPANLCASSPEEADKIDQAEPKEKSKMKPKDKQEPKSWDELERRPSDDLEHKSQDEQESIGDAKQTKKKPLDRNRPSRSPFSAHRRQSPRRSIDFTKIKFLDARTGLWDTPTTPTDEGDSSSMIKHNRRPRLKIGPVISRKWYGIPLCGRPSLIMGMPCPSSKETQLRQEQLYQQPEYQDQHALMLQSQLRQQEDFNDKQTMPRTLRFVLGTEPYGVPSKKQFQRVQKGQRYCGNFYYN
ncbi:uncharacterized protein [Drosophila pseudoobscura]|uniref:Uncharacterized protein n=1 Tax=Drosophila pseudoobscura pseudoobscura TaxID=46245 RepID=A0A6I8UVG2_DROPS|nr:uncharacterized protein LOC4805073 [Drosophila pseudoobscura]